MKYFLNLILKGTITLYLYKYVNLSKLIKRLKYIGIYIKNNKI